MDVATLNTILDLHHKWLHTERDGERADLTDADLSGMALAGTNLSDANLAGASLWNADLTGANLAGADLSGADLTGATLTGAILTGANLSGAGLGGATLTDADLSGMAVPTVPHLDAAILAAVADGGSLDMERWHGCDTTHCRAGWAITLAGEAGRDLEARIGPAAAGALVYAASRPDLPVPNFYASDEEAMGDIRARAERDPLA